MEAGSSCLTHYSSSHLLPGLDGRKSLRVVFEDGTSEPCKQNPGAAPTFIAVSASLFCLQGYSHFLPKWISGDVPSSPWTLLVRHRAGPSPPGLPPSSGSSPTLPTHSLNCDPAEPHAAWKAKGLLSKAGPVGWVLRNLACAFSLSLILGANLLASLEPPLRLPLAPLPTPKVGLDAPPGLPGYHILNHARLPGCGHVS